MEYSNKFLVSLLIVAIVVSGIGTFITVNRLRIMPAPVISGAGTSGAGTVSVEILSSLAIAVMDSTINFGSCTPGADNTTTFDSNNTLTDGIGASQCSNMDDPQNITVQTIGNTAANISIQTNNVLLTGDSSILNQSLFFAWRNSTDFPQCWKATNNTNAWMNFSGTSIEHYLCQNLTTNGKIWTFIRVYVPFDSQVGTRTATITFTGRSVNQ